MTYLSTILADSPTALYPVNESSGTTAFDATSNHYNGSYTGVSAYSVPGAIYQDLNTAIAFTASGGLALPRTLNIYSFSALTIEYWIQQGGNWYYVAITTSNATGLTLYYVNGLLTSPSASIGSLNVFLGPNFDATGSASASGALAFVGIYNYALTATQILNHWLVGSGEGQLGQLIVYIAGRGYAILDNSLKISDKVNQRSTCAFSLVDPTGNATFTKGQPVTVVDSLYGTLFSGYVNDPDANLLYPNTNRKWNIDCIDQIWLADKRPSNAIYNNQPAGVIVCDQLQTILSQEGVTGAFALDYDHLLSDWTAGATLSGVVATTNTGDGNPGDGDIELAPAGTAISYTDNFSTGTLTNVVDNSGTLSLASTQGLQLLGTAVQGNSNPYIYYQIWTGSVSIASGDKLVYDVWTADTCPVQEAGADLGCTDGTSLRDFTPPITDQNNIGAHPSNDLSGFATDQWYTRTFDLTPMAGKTIAYCSVALEGNTNGAYAAYFRHVKLVSSGGGTKQVFFESSLQTNQIIGLSAYINISLQQCTVYEMSGNRQAPAISLSSLNIPKTSLIDFVAPAPQSSLFPGVASTNKTLPTVSVQTSIDNGATWQTCTNYGAIPNIIAGMAMSGRQLLLQQVFTMLGPDPTITPTLTGLALSIQPSYASTKSDVIQTEQTSSDWNGGTLHDLMVSGGQMSLNYVAQNWNSGPLSGQTVFGATGCFQELLNGQCYVAVPAGATNDVRSRLDFAGQWQNFTMDVDIAIGTPLANTAVGVVYRTTGWQNNEDTYAYKAWYTPGLLNLGYGTNSSSGTGTYTSLASVALTLSSGASHRMRIVVSGSSHQVYIDGTLIISLSDSTYTAAGYFGLFFYNNASPAATHGGLFDNFGVDQILTGYWIGPSQGLGAAGTYATSLVSWQDIPDPTNTTLLSIFSSIDGGTSYQQCTNGGPIPGLTVGQSLSSIHVQMQAIFQTTNAEFSPILTGLTAWVLGQFSSSGTWTSPSLNCANAGRAAASVVNWNAVLPNNQTTLSVQTSVDGGSTWQTISTAGNPVPNVTLQPAQYADIFEDNDSADYTPTSQSGGANATVTWDTVNSRLIMAGGTNAALLANSLTGIGDVDMFCNLDMADNGGLVWHWLDNQDYYKLQIGDASAATNTNKAILSKVSSGTTTQLASVTISFVRLMFHCFRVTMFGNIITVYQNGTQIAQYTDASALGAGQCGLYNTGNTSRFYQFSVQAQGQLTSSLHVLTKLSLASTDPLNTPQVTDVATMVSGPSIGIGATIPSTTYKQTFVSKNVDDLNRQSNYWWDITSKGTFPGLAIKQLVFQPENASPAPFVIAQANQLTTLYGQTIGDIQVANLKVKYSGDLYRNQMILQNAHATQTFTQQFVGDGKTKSWALTYPVAAGTVPQISISSSATVPQSIGIKGQDSGRAYYYTPGNTNIDQDASQGILSGLQTLIVTYTGTFLQDVMRNNTGGFPGTVSQAQYAAIDGTSGIVCVVEDLSQSDATVNMTVAQAEAYGDSQLQRFGVIGRIVTFDTYRIGLLPGQQLSVFIPLHKMQNAQTLVTQVDTSARMGPDAKPVYKFSVTASESPALGDWTKLVGSVFS